MGCGASKCCSSTSEALELRGTTLIGFVYRGGVVIGSESRASNEHDVLQGRLTIRDDRCKMVAIGKKIIYVVQGSEKDCDNMIEDMGNKFQRADREPPSVSCVVETMYEYLENLDANKRCGAIIGGWDASGPQVHRVFMKNGRAVKDRVLRPGTLASGQIYALRILKDGYDYNMSYDGATRLAYKALFNATYYDKHSGGLIRVYHINEKEAYRFPEIDALEAYARYYDLHLSDERKTLFLIVDAGSEPISANDLKEHFKPDAKLLASHRVALLQSGHYRFYFHRLVFESENYADVAYRTATTHGRTSPSYLQQFPGQVILENKTPSVAVYVNWSSRELVEFLHEQCQILYR